MLYRRLDIWRRIGSKRAVVYRCLERISDGRYCVQSADFVDAEADASTHTEFEKQFVELFCEQDPGERSGLFVSIEAAIADFDDQFGNPLDS